MLAPGRTLLKAHVSVESILFARDFSTNGNPTRSFSSCLRSVEQAPPSNAISIHNWSRKAVRLVSLFDDTLPAKCEQIPHGQHLHAIILVFFQFVRE